MVRDETSSGPVTLLRLKRTATEPLPDAVHVRMKRRRLSNAFDMMSLSSRYSNERDHVEEERRPHSTDPGGHGADTETVVFRRVRFSPDSSEGPIEQKQRQAHIVDVDERSINELQNDMDQGEAKNSRGEATKQDYSGRIGAHFEGSEHNFLLFAQTNVTTEQLSVLGYGEDVLQDSSRVLYLDGDSIPELSAAVDSDESDEFDCSDLDAQTVDYPSTPCGSEEDEDSDDVYDYNNCESDGEEWERYERFGRDMEAYDSEI